MRTILALNFNKLDRKGPLRKARDFKPDNPASGAKIEDV
jgi:hypothetical protein